MRGFELHDALRNQCACGSARLAGYDLYDMGEWPAIVPGTGTVYGELYQVDERCLVHLHELEDYRPDRPTESLYVLQPCVIEIGPPVDAGPSTSTRRGSHWLAEGQPAGGGVAAWTYVYNQNLAGAPKINSGNYRQYCQISS